MILGASIGTTRYIANFLLDALVLHVPFSHLTKEQELIVLVERPAHVKNIRMYRTCKQCLHVLFAFGMELKSPGELFHISRQDLGFESVQTHVLVERRNECLLMTVGSEDQVSRHE